MQCRECGSPIEAGDLFCENCGAKVEAEQPAEDVAKTRRCPQCGAEASHDGAFCQACGVPLPEEAAADAQGGPGPQQRVCGTCGNPLSEEDRFCMQCGASVEAKAPAAGAQPFLQDHAPTGQAEAPIQPQQAGPPAVEWQPQQAAADGAPPAEGDNQSGKKKKKGLIIGVACGLVAALAAVLFLFVLDFRTPAQKARDALDNTSSAMQKLSEQLSDDIGLTAIQDQRTKNPVKTEVGFTIEEIPSSSFPGPVAISFTSEMDQPNRRLHSAVGVGVSGATLLQLQLDVDDSLIAIASPELFEGSYGFRSDTLGQDLLNSTLGDLLSAASGELPLDELSFNVFDILEQYGDASALELTEETSAALEKLVDELWDKSTVKSAGTQDVSVNGITKATDLYNVVIPKEAFLEYIRSLFNAVFEDETVQGFYSGLMLGLSNSFASTVDEEELRAGIDEIIAELDEMIAGDILLDVYAHKNQCVKLALRFTIASDYSDPQEIAIVIEFGGENSLLDAMTISAAMDDNTLFEIYTKGATAPKDGKYHYSMELYVSDGYGDERVNMLTMALEYDTNKALDNFSWTFDMPESDVMGAVRGTLLIDKGNKTIDADLYDIRFTETYYEETMRFSYTYKMAPLTSPQFETPDPKLITSMSQNELMSLVMEIAASMQALDFGF